MIFNFIGLWLLTFILGVAIRAGVSWSHFRMHWKSFLTKWGIFCLLMMVVFCGIALFHLERTLFGWMLDNE
jgi:hypothetical protein